MNDQMNILRRGRVTQELVECPHCRKQSGSHYLDGFAPNDRGVTVRRYRCDNWMCNEFFIAYRD